MVAGSLAVLMLRAAAAVVAAVVLGSSLWLMASPRSDQPLLDAIEQATGLGTVYLLKSADRATYADAAADVLRFTHEAERLAAREAARDGTSLAADEVERIASYRHAFEEMAAGERFVQGVLRQRAHEAARFVLGVPAAVLSAACLALVLGGAWRKRRSSAA